MCVCGVYKNLDHCHWPACVCPCVSLGGLLTLLDRAPHTTHTNHPPKYFLSLFRSFFFFISFLQTHSSAASLRQVPPLSVTFIYGALVHFLFIFLDVNSPSFSIYIFFISHNCLMGKKPNPLCGEKLDLGDHRVYFATNPIKLFLSKEQTFNEPILETHL